MTRMASSGKKIARPPPVKKQTGTLKSAFTDAIATAVFVFASSVFGEVILLYSTTAHSIFGSALASSHVMDYSALGQQGLQASF